MQSKSYLSNDKRVIYYDYFVLKHTNTGITSIFNILIRLLMRILL